MKTARFLCFALCAFLCVSFVSAQVLTPVGERKLPEEGFAPMFPFLLEKGLPDSITNINTWGDFGRPLGAADALSIRGDQFVRDGKPFHYIGTNICGVGAFPSRENAEKIAESLVRYGITVVRLHHMDSGNIWGKNAERTFTEIDNELLDRLDYFIAQLEKNGIYVNLNLHVGRTLDGRDGFENAQTIPNMSKGLDIFEPRMIDLAEKYARDLLTHVNPYTGLPYTRDPGVAMIEINNENSTVASWFQLHFEPLGPPYSDLFRQYWNEWLVKKYSSTENLKKVWGDSAGSWDGWSIEEKTVPILSRLGTGPLAITPVVYADFLTFLIELETRYWNRLYAFIKDELKAAAPVSGTQLLFGSWYAQSALDYCDEHAYWNHPVFPATLPPHSAWDSSDWYVDGSALVNDSMGGTLSRLSINRVLGRPVTVSEYDHPSPNFYAAEGLPMLCAFGAFQNWTGVNQFTWSGDQIDLNIYESFFARLSADSSKLVHLPACWAMLVRGDVRRGPGQYVHKRAMSRVNEVETAAQLITATTLDQFMSVLRDGSDLSMAFYSGLELTDSPECIENTPKNLQNIADWSEAPQKFGSPQSGKVVNEFGEISWNFEQSGAAFFTVDTPGTKLFTGFVRNREFALSGVTLAPKATRLDWATVSITRAGSQSPEAPKSNEKPILAAGRYLIAATAAQMATDSKFIDLGEDRITSNPIYGGADGHTPPMCEGVPMTVTLDGRAPNVVKVFALDEAGLPKKEIPVRSIDGGCAFDLGPEFKTLWYEMRID